MVVGSNPTRLAKLSSIRKAPGPDRRVGDTSGRIRLRSMLRLNTRLRTAERHRRADRVFIATLVVGFFAIAMLLVTLYPSPMHLLRLV